VQLAHQAGARVIATLLYYSLSGHSFDFWDKFWGKTLAGWKPCWNQQLRKVW